MWVETGVLNMMVIDWLSMGLTSVKTLFVTTNCITTEQNEEHQSNFFVLIKSTPQVSVTTKHK